MLRTFRNWLHSLLGLYETTELRQIRTTYHWEKFTQPNLPARQVPPKIGKRAKAKASRRRNRRGY